MQMKATDTLPVLSYIINPYVQNIVLQMTNSR